METTITFAEIKLYLFFISLLTFFLIIPLYLIVFSKGGYFYLAKGLVIDYLSLYYLLIIFLMCLVLMFFIFEKKVETLFIFLGNSKKEDLAVLFDQKINNTRFIILVFVFLIEILLIINLIFILPNAL